jgi:hypothetical protein
MFNSDSRTSIAGEAFARVHSNGKQNSDIWP